MFRSLNVLGMCFCVLTAPSYVKRANSRRSSVDARSSLSRKPVNMVGLLFTYQIGHGLSNEIGFVHFEAPRGRIMETTCQGKDLE